MKVKWKLFFVLFVFISLFLLRDGYVSMFWRDILYIFLFRLYMPIVFIIFFYKRKYIIWMMSFMILYHVITEIFKDLNGAGYDVYKYTVILVDVREIINPIVLLSATGILIIHYIYDKVAKD